MCVCFQIHVAEDSFAWIVPWVTSVIFHVMEHLWLSVEHIMDDSAIDYDLEVVLQIAVLDLLNDNITESIEGKIKWTVVKIIGISADI